MARMKNKNLGNKSIILIKDISQASGHSSSYISSHSNNLDTKNGLSIVLSNTNPDNGG